MNFQKGVTDTYAFYFDAQDSSYLTGIRPNFMTGIKPDFLGFLACLEGLSQREQEITAIYHEEWNMISVTMLREDWSRLFEWMDVVAKRAKLCRCLNPINEESIGGNLRIGTDKDLVEDRE